MDVRELAKKLKRGTGIDRLKGGLKRAKDGYRLATNIFRLAVRRTNELVDIAELQRTYKAEKEKVVAIRIRDVNYTAYITIRDGRVQFLDNPEKVHHEVELNYQVLKWLVNGKRPVTDPGTGTEYHETYTPLDAWFDGEIETYGEQATNEAYLFLKVIYNQVFPVIREELLGLS